MPKDQLFSSYSHKDKKWLQELEKHLKPYLRNRTITSWSDQKIVPGSEWFKEIQSALANSKVAALRSRSARPAAAALDCIVITDKVACFKPPPGILGVTADSSFLPPGVL